MKLIRNPNYIEICNCGKEMIINKDTYKHIREYKNGKMVEHEEYICECRCKRRLWKEVNKKEV